MGEPALNLAETLTISIGRSRKETNWKQVKMLWSRLVDHLHNPVVTEETVEEFFEMSHDEQQEVKDVGGYVGGVIRGSARKIDAVESRDVIMWDADYGDMSIWDAWGMMVGKAAVLHSTHKHTPENPRLRIVAPLKRPVTPLEYEAIGRKIADLMDIEAFDDTTYEANRLMFWPSHPKDAEYVFEEMEGEWLDPDEILATYKDWHDMREWPVSSRKQKAIRKMGEKQGNPLEKPGVIGAFNRAYSISAAIDKYLSDVYSPCGGDRYTYIHGTSTAGAVVYDDDTFLYSHHDHDPVSGRLCNAYDLVRLHKFGDKDKDMDPDAPLSDLPSTAAMKKFCAEDENVRAELAANVRQDPSDVFAAPTDGLQRFADDRTEQGSAIQFVDEYGHRLGYCNSYEWLLWNGQKWETDAEPEVHMLVMTFADEVYGQARVQATLATDKYSKEMAEAELKRAVKLRSLSGQQKVISQASSILNKKDASIYDANPWDLNTPDGIIDLRTGVLRGHDPEAMCTKVTGCGLDTTPEGVKMWNDFIRYITAGDEDFANYLQMLMGMAAIGKVYEEGLVISYGPGGNGKSTFFGAIARVLGDYAKTLNAETVTPVTGKADENYIVMLRGVRLAIMGETDENAKLAIAGMKRITSQDSIAARANYHKPEEFIPSHTIIMHTNHLPRLNSLDGGTKRRIAVAPFPATLPPSQVIMDYKSKLVEEAGGAILQWIIDGAKKFFLSDCKLRKPAVVEQATEQYIRDEDTIQQFIDDKCSVGDELFEDAGALYREFAAWAKENGLWERNPTLFGRALDTKGYMKMKTGNRRKRKGLKLNTVFNTEL